MTNLRNFLEATAQKFKAAGIASFQADAEILIADSLEITRGELLTKVFLAEEFDPNPTLEALIARRVMREPLQHLIGFAHFRNLKLKVGPGVFIPRPETEAVVSVALDFLKSQENPVALDIGTGSGAVAISIATESNADVTAIELSEKAAEFARENIASHGAAVKLLVGDFQELALSVEGYDLIVSNPPYIPVQAVPLDPEVRDYDPELALYGGEDGLDLIREIVEIGLVSIRPGGMLLIEHADGQSDSVRELLLAQYQNVRVYPDPTGRLRFVSAIR
jgi:release factor glutamine methyltransferase